MDKCSFQDIILLPPSPKFTQENIYWNSSAVQKKKTGIRGRQTDRQRAPPGHNPDTDDTLRKNRKAI